MKKPIRTKKAIAQDKNIKALHSGKRESEDGNVYYENRPNRSDENRTTKLAEGGGLGLSKDEIKVALEKAQKQLALAEKMNAPQAAKDLATRKIADFTKQLEDADKIVEKKVEPKKSAIPVKKEKAVVKPSVPVKKAAKTVKASAPVKKVEKEVKPTKEKKEKKFVTIDGVKYYEDTKEFCEAIGIAWDKRLVSMKKANKKYKTKSISELIGGDIASVVVKTIENVSEDLIAKNPKLYFAKFEKLEVSANVFSKSLKDLLGDDYDNSEIKSELEDIEKAIDKIKNKFKK